MFRLLLTRMQSRFLEVLADLELVAFGALGGFLVLTVPQMPKPLTAVVVLLSLAFLLYGLLDLWRMLRAPRHSRVSGGRYPPSA